MSTHEEIQYIRNHFANITVKEFEEKMQRAGMGTIRPASDWGYELAPLSSGELERGEKLYEK